MNNLKKLLAKSGFKRITGDREQGAVPIICFDALPNASRLGNEVFQKNRSSLLGLPVIVGISPGVATMLLCQVAGEAGQNDPRIKDGGLVWQMDQFTNEAGAIAYIKKAVSEEGAFGLLYGPKFPEKIPERTQTREE